MIRRLLIPTVAVGLLATSACTDNAPAPAPGDDAAAARVLTVAASDTECTVSAAEAPSGTITFKVTNDGTKINEFYLLGEDGLRIVAEVENIGPGLTRDLVLTAPTGTYFTACKPGMVGDGIRAGFTITDSGEPVGPTGEDADLVKEADTQYASYVRDQVDQLLVKTQQFAQLVTERKDDEARA
ncbi:MAG: cupredoxin domain-containing protein, partial [Propionibacteriaceae bacterium]|nr:cupredoxin domain-containing protein [Propionibacteriaceae bacterium]